MATTLTFLGAAGTVTGSRFLVECGRRQVLVDCGLFQGYKDVRKRNWAPMPMRASGLSGVILTHAHVDHTGYLPVLHRQGFKGPAWCSAGTADLARILLPDSGHLQEEEADFLNRHGRTRHSPALPLYTREDAENALPLLREVPFHSDVVVSRSLRFRFVPAGHILGASSVLMDCGGHRIGFSGDLGRPVDVLMPPPEPMPAVDTLLVEATYGNRVHEQDDPKDRLARVISATFVRGGMVLIPAFAVGRTQTLLHLLYELRLEGRIPPDTRLVVDSPMAAAATRMYHAAGAGGRLRQAPGEPLWSGIEVATTPEDSKALHPDGRPLVVLSASGMATGGRVLHHLYKLLPDAKNTVLFVGYQAGGTRGAALAGGATHVRIFAESVPVHARVESIAGLSAHADRVEILAWLRQLPRPPRRVFIVHAEPEAAESMRILLRDELQWDAEVPYYMQKVAL